MASALGEVMNRGELLLGSFSEEEDNPSGEDVSRSIRALIEQFGKQKLLWTREYGHSLPDLN